MQIISELLFLLVSNNKSKIIIIILLTFLHQIFMLLPAILLGKIVDAVALKNLDEVSYYVACFILSAMVACIVWPIQLRYACDLYHRTSAAMGVRWCFDILKQDAPFFFKNRVGEIIRAFDRGVQDFPWAQQCVVESIVFNAVKAFIIIIYILYLGGSWEFAFITLFVLLNVALSYYIIRKKRYVVQQGLLAEERISGSQGELIEAFKSIQFLGAQETATLDLEDAFDNARVYNVRFAFLSSFLVSLRNFSPAILAFTIIFIGVYYDTKISGGDFIPIYVFSSELLRMCLGMVATIADLEIFKEDTKKIEHIRSQKTVRGQTSSKVLLNHNITINPFRISFSEQEVGTDLICEETIHISEGSRVAIIGASGQGKTTLARMISGLKWSKKAVFIGGHDLADLSQTNLTEALFFSEQNSCFLHGDFYQAVFYGSEVEDLVALERVFKELGIAHYLSLLKSGEFPKELSTGEKKIFSVLRAIGLKRPITLLDEPTESVEWDQSSRLWQTIFAAFNQKTVICLTHDREAISYFDLVLEIKDHKIQKLTHHSRD